MKVIKARDRTAKKYLRSALLALLFCAALCGCGVFLSKEEHAIRKSETLLAEEAYDDALSALGGFQDNAEIKKLREYITARRDYADEINRFSAHVGDIRARFEALGEYRDCAEYTAFFDCFGDMLPEKLEAVLAWNLFSAERGERTFDYYMSKNAYTLENRIKALAFLNAYQKLAGEKAIISTDNCAIYENKNSIDALASSLPASAGGKAVVCEARPYEEAVSLNMGESMSLPAGLRPTAAGDVSWIIAVETEKVVVGRYALGGSAWKLIGAVKVYRAGSAVPIYTSDSIAGGEPPSVIHNTVGGTGTAPDMTAALAGAILWLQSTAPERQPPETSAVTASEVYAELEVICEAMGYAFESGRDEVKIIDARTYSEHTAESIYTLVHEDDYESEVWLSEAEGGTELSAQYQELQAISADAALSFYIIGKNDELLFWAQNGVIRVDATGLS